MDDEELRKRLRRSAERPADPFEFHADLTDALLRTKMVLSRLEKGHVPSEVERAELAKWLPKMRAIAEEMAEQVRTLGEFTAGLAELRGDPEPDAVCECGHFYAQHSVWHGDGDPRAARCGEMILLRFPDRMHVCGCAWFREVGREMSEADRRTREDIIEWAVLTGWRDMFGRELTAPVPERLSPNLIRDYLTAHPHTDYDGGW